MCGFPERDEAVVLFVLQKSEASSDVSHRLWPSLGYTRWQYQKSDPSLLTNKSPKTFRGSSDKLEVWWGAQVNPREGHMPWTEDCKNEEWEGTRVG